MNELEQIKHRLREFAKARDWEQLMYMDIRMPWLYGRTGKVHSPKNLTMALKSEVAEILEHFQ